MATSNAPFANCQSVGETLGDQVRMRRELVVGKDFPVGKAVRAHARVEPRDLLAQALGVQRGSGEDEEAARTARGRLAREEKRVRGAGRVQRRPGHGSREAMRR
jgi:hypothetical protein